VLWKQRQKNFPAKIAANVSGVPTLAAWHVEDRWIKVLLKTNPAPGAITNHQGSRKKE
jgi:hypothetical protein